MIKWSKFEISKCLNRLQNIFENMSLWLKLSFFRNERSKDVKQRNGLKIK